MVAERLAADTRVARGPIAPGVGSEVKAEALVDAGVLAVKEQNVVEEAGGLQPLVTEEAEIGRL